MTAFLSAVALSIAAADPGAAVEALLRGDAAWERRADSGPAAGLALEEAKAAYEEALERDPASLEAHWKLLRAIYFLADRMNDRAEARGVLEQGRRLAESALDLLARHVGDRQRLDAMEPAAVAGALEDVPEAARIYFWSALDWGLWGQAFSKLKAARQGVAGRLRDYSEIVIALDPEYEAGGGHRILGQLHAEAPRIPFITGWVDREKAIAELRRAHGIAPEEPWNRLYLAEALLDHGPPEERPEATALLAALAELEPRPGRRIEDERIRDQARKRIGELRR